MKITKITAGTIFAGILASCQMQPAIADDNLQAICKDQAWLAELVMKSRQLGVPATRSLEIINNNFTQKNWREFGAGVVELAYSMPRFNSKNTKIKLSLISEAKSL